MLLLSYVWVVCNLLFSIHVKVFSTRTQFKHKQGLKWTGALFRFVAIWNLPIPSRHCNNHRSKWEQHVNKGKACRFVVISLSRPEHKLLTIRILCIIRIVSHLLVSLLGLGRTYDEHRRGNVHSNPVLVGHSDSFF